MKIILKVLTVTIMCCSFYANGQNLVPTTICGVSIAEDTLPPNKMSILDIRSINKGVSMPNVSYAQMDSISPHSSTELSELMDGMVVFVEESVNPGSYKDDDDQRGFYYWHHDYADVTKSAWLQIQPVDIVYPLGSIIMISNAVAINSSNNFDADGMGKPNTEYENWHLCNGKVYASGDMSGISIPDLRGMFVVGIDAENDDYKALGASGGVESHNLEEHFPEHRHIVDNERARLSEIEFGDHTHDYEIIDKPQHKHKYRTTKDESYGIGYPRANRDEKWIGKKWFRIVSEKKVKNISTSIHKDDINVPASAGELTFTLSDDTFSIEGTGANAVIDNRPAYYVVAYIIRVKMGDEYLNPVGFDLADDDNKPYVDNEIFINHED